MHEWRAGEIMELVRKNPSELLSEINKAYFYDIKKFYEWSDGRSLNSDLVLNYFEHLRQSGKKAATIGRHKVAIKALLKNERLSLSESAKLDTFFKSIKTGTRDASISQDDVLTPDELSALIKQSGKKTGLIIRALFETACRVSELSNIKLSNCKRKPDGVEIMILGKGQKEGFCFMPLELFEEIRRTFNGQKFLFETSHEKAISRKTIHVLIKRAAAKIGRTDIHAHTLRHTWATLSINNLGLSKVSKYLRHSSADITARYYLHGQATLKEIIQNNKCGVK